jgi:hypothetical protein
MFERLCLYLLYQNQSNMTPLHLAGNAIFFMAVLCALIHEAGIAFEIFYINRRLSKYDPK